MAAPAFASGAMVLRGCDSRRHLVQPITCLPSGRRDRVPSARTKCW